MQKKSLIILSLIFFLLFISCQEKNSFKLSAKKLKEINTLDSFMKIPEIREQIKKWDKKNYNEPTLFDAKTETYRFIWRSSFDGWEVVRIEEQDGNYKVIKKKAENLSDTIGDIKEFKISKHVWDNIVNTFESKGFWTYKYNINRIGLDGSFWTLEGYKPAEDKYTLKNYHIVQRWSPKDSTFISMCKLLSELKEN